MNIAVIFSGGGSLVLEHLLVNMLSTEAFQLTRGNFQPYKETLSHNAE